MLESILPIRRVVPTMIVLLLSGCGGWPPPKPAATPNAAAVQFALAVRSGDKRGILSTVKATAQQRNAVEAFVRFMQASNEFRDRFIKAYGQQAWDLFNDPGHDPSQSNPAARGGNSALYSATDADIQHLKDASPKIDGDRATIPAASADEQPIALVKVDGGWLVDFGGVVPPGADPEKWGDLMDRMAMTVHKYQKAIGYKDITPDDIDVELGRALGAEFGFTASDKRLPRFIIDNLH